MPDFDKRVEQTEPPDEDEGVVFVVRVKGNDALDARRVVDRALEEWAASADVSDYGTEDYEE